MKPIVLNETAKEEITNKFLDELKKMFENYSFSKGEELVFKTSVGEKLKDKILIVYTPTAYLRMKTLVEEFDSEVSWFGLVRKESPKLYHVYDVIVCKQQVDGSKVDTRDEDMLEFYSNLTDEQAENMRFQAHSHVNFSTSASGTDVQNQMDIISNIPGRKGFYLFQIWNKRDEISTYLYDLDENKYYDKNDIDLEIEDEDYGTMSDFVISSRNLVEKIQTKVPKTEPVKYYKTSWQNQKEYYPKEFRPADSFDYRNRFLYGVPDYDVYENGYNEEQEGFTENTYLDFIRKETK